MSDDRPLYQIPVEEMTPEQREQYEAGMAKVKGSALSIACWIIGLFNAVLFVVILVTVPWLAPLPFLTAVVFCGIGLGAGRAARRS